MTEQRMQDLPRLGCTSMRKSSGPDPETINLTWMVAQHFRALKTIDRFMVSGLGLRFFVFRVRVYLI